MHSRRYFLGGESPQELLRVVLPLGELSPQIGPCGLLPELTGLLREEDALALQGGTQEGRAAGAERLIVKMGVLATHPSQVTAVTRRFGRQDYHVGVEENLNISRFVARR